MKKIILAIFIICFTILPVNAKENRLYFTESGNRIYFDGELLDDKVFMYHTDMVPGKQYLDELTIENGTNTIYILYFQVKPKEQNNEIEELLNNILMKITLDGNIIYEGVSTGLETNGINLQNSILLGDFKPSNKSKMIVETKLSEAYSNTELNELSYIDWAFYAQYDINPPIEITESPYTKRDFPTNIIIVIIVILIGIVLVNNKKKKSQNHH